MSKSHLEFLRHILEEIDYLLQACEGLEKDTFLNNGTLNRAFVRSLEIIGEATKKIDLIGGRLDQSGALLVCQVQHAWWGAGIITII